MKNKIIQSLKPNLTITDKILLALFSNYTCKVYQQGVLKGFNLFD